jgi:hypothetical protein
MKNNNVAIIHVGETLPTWCHVHGTDSPHRYEGWRLVCVLCEQEQKDKIQPA